MTATGDPYSVLGRSYAARRRPDPRIADLIRAALGDARSVLNVGAGTGSYEPTDRQVVAVEPSPVMIRQRQATAAPVIRATAENLPFADQLFDAALAILTVHHWPSGPAGLAELRRVARRQVVLTWDQEIFAQFWLVRDYLPEIAEHERQLSCLTVVRDELARSELARGELADGELADGELADGELARSGRPPVVREVPVPGNCTDGFLGAYWRRPEAYLSPEVRAGMSGIALLDQGVVAAGIGRLAADLASGRWHERHGHLLQRDAADLGYRLVTAGEPL